MYSMPSPPSKEWMTASRLSVEYLEGVESFFQFIRANTHVLGAEDWYCCPCVKCRNLFGGKKKIRDIRAHLICDGIDKSYKLWIHHGEVHPQIQVNIGTNASVLDHSEDGFPRMVDMVNDIFGHVPDIDIVQPNLGSTTSVGMDETNDECDFEDKDDFSKNVQYKMLMEDALQPLYPLCRNEDTKLSVTVELLSMKARHQWSNKSFTELLQIIKKILPDKNTLPDSTFTAKKMIKSLRMDCKVIHACRNDCILYWKEYENRENCPTCGESRWKPINELLPTSSRKPWKKLRYFPLAPRLQRLYSIPWIAKNMTWHANASLVPNEVIMRHPTDSSCWKQVNRKWDNFAAEIRNVRLGLATDGFNPFGNNNNSYNCWPVMIVPYNLPPSLCMRKEFTMLTLLIPGKKGPGHEIDVYLQPLIAELNELWCTGVITYDSYTKSKFTMKAILLWAIHDFPAYGHLSGCRTAGKYGCPVCGERVDSVWLNHGKKFAYMGHRRFLSSMNHPFRSQKSQFNGNEKHLKHPRRLSGSEVLCKMETVETKFEKLAGKKRKHNKDDNKYTAWSKRSIFFDLPYWKDLSIRHNLDVMHVEKNVAENLLATIMNVKDKTKDGLQARQDLKVMKIKKKLWPVETNGKLICPEAPYTLTRMEKDLICKTLYHLKVPIGYSANWKHNVCLEDCELKNLKSHDYHILMQQLIPVLLMHAFKTQKPLRAAIRQLSIFFNVLCSKVINRDELSKMKERVVETLCVFEKYFPPSFFVSMTHLVVHLAEEAQICGPVRYRWMYPFERMMKTYKRYVTNQAYPEGSIAECFLMEESMMYAMNYIADGRKGSHELAQRTFMDVDGECPYPNDKKGKVYVLENVQYEQVRKWVLRQNPENVVWEKYYETYLQSLKSSSQNRRGNVRIEGALDYVPWLRQQLQNEENSIFKRLVDGPSFEAISYSGYAINGYIFTTAESEKNKSTQNCGVSMKAITCFRSSAKDLNPVDEEITYYGIIKQILELDYTDFRQTVFCCDWVCVKDANGYRVDPETNLIYVNLGRLMRNTKESDEPFILSSQATQVFFCKDHSRPTEDWHVVLEVPKRLSRNVDSFENPFVFETRMNENNIATTLQDDIIEEQTMEVDEV